MWCEEYIDHKPRDIRVLQRLINIIPVITGQYIVQRVASQCDFSCRLSASSWHGGGNGGSGVVAKKWQEVTAGVG